MERMDIVFSGLGGQGVMTMLQVLAAAAGRERRPVKIFEGTGLTQRGGGVFGFVRLGETYSARIPMAGAEAIVSLEISEVARVIPFLKPQGEVWSSSGEIHGYDTKLHPHLYPAAAKIAALVQLRTPHLHLIPAPRLAKEAGSSQAVNMVMLGAFSRKNPFLDPDSITWAMEQVSPTFAKVNQEAFWRGFRFVQTEPRGGRADRHPITCS